VGYRPSSEHHACFGREMRCDGSNGYAMGHAQFGRVQERERELSGGGAHVAGGLRPDGYHHGCDEVRQSDVAGDHQIRKTLWGHAGASARGQDSEGSDHEASDDSDDSDDQKLLELEPPLTGKSRWGLLRGSLLSSSSAVDQRAGSNDDLVPGAAAALRATPPLASPERGRAKSECTRGWGVLRQSLWSERRSDDSTPPERPGSGVSLGEIGPLPFFGGGFLRRSDSSDRESYDERESACESERESALSVCERDTEGECISPRQLRRGNSATSSCASGLSLSDPQVAPELAALVALTSSLGHSGGHPPADGADGDGLADCSRPSILKHSRPHNERYDRASHDLRGSAASSSGLGYQRPEVAFDVDKDGRGSRSEGKRRSLSMPCSHCPLCGISVPRSMRTKATSIVGNMCSPHASTRSLSLAVASSSSQRSASVRPPANRPPKARRHGITAIDRSRAQLSAGDRLRAGVFGLHYTEASCGGRADKKLVHATGMVSGALKDCPRHGRSPELRQELKAELEQMDKDWQADLLSVAFDRPIAFNTHIASVHVIRGQHLTVVVSGKSMTTAVRVDLSKLIPPTMVPPNPSADAPPLVVPFHEPLVRNGLTVGYLSGELSLGLEGKP